MTVLLMIFGLATSLLYTCAIGPILDDINMAIENPSTELCSKLEKIENASFITALIGFISLGSGIILFLIG